MSERDEQDVQRRIANRLASLVPGGGLAWNAAPPYLRSHLAAHAAAGGTLASFITDLGYVGAADPIRLVPNLVHLIDDSQSNVAAVARAYLRLGTARVGKTFAQRIANLTTDALVHGTPLAHVAAVADVLPWLALFSNGRSPETEFDAAGETFVLTALDVATFDGCGAVVTADAYRRIQVWDANHSDVARSWSAHAAPIRSVALHPHGGHLRVISGSDDRSIALWDCETGALERRIACLSPVLSLTVFDWSGRPVCAAGHADGEVRVYDLGTGGVVHAYSAHSDAVSTITHLQGPSGTILASGGWDRALVTYNLDTETTLARAGGPTGSLLDVDATVDNNGTPIVAAAYADEKVWIWDIDGRQIRELRGHTAGVSSVALLSTSSRVLVASGGSDMLIQIWDAGTGENLATLARHDAGIRALNFLPRPDGTSDLISIGADRTMRTWPVDQEIAAQNKSKMRLNLVMRNTAPQHLATKTPGRRALIRAVTTLPGYDDAVVAAGSLDDSIQLCDAAGTVVRQWAGHDGGVLALSAFTHHDAHLLASAGWDGNTRLWDMSNGTLVHEWRRQQSVWGLTHSAHNGRALMMAGGRDGTVHVHDAGSGETIAILDGPNERIWGVDCAWLDGELVVAAGCTDRTVWLWNVDTAQPIRQLRGHRRGVRYVAFADMDGAPTVLASSADGTLLRWDPHDEDPADTYEGHSDAVWGVATGAVNGGLIAASAGEDMSVRLWNLTTTASVAVPLNSPAYAVAIENGNLYIGSGADFLCVQLGERLLDEIAAVNEP